VTTSALIICRADEVEGKVAASKPAAVLSIEHPGVKQGEKGYAPRLTDGTPQLLLTFWDVEMEIKDGPDLAQVEQGLAFAMEHIRKGDVIIHCHAGKARSTGLALGVLSQLYPRENEEALLKRLLAIRPEAAPNIAVVEMVDRLTGRGGKLLQAVKDHPQITAARAEADIGREHWRKNNPEKNPPNWRPKL
jgi:predicted protein tyrosine phosphatase